MITERFDMDAETDRDMPMEMEVDGDVVMEEQEDNDKYTMSKFERVAVVQRRVMQLTRGIDGYTVRGASELLGISEEELKKTPEPELMVAIAHEELRRRKIGFVIVRTRHDGTVIDRIPVSQMVVT